MPALHRWFLISNLVKSKMPYSKLGSKLKDDTGLIAKPIPKPTFPERLIFKVLVLADFVVVMVPSLYCDFDLVEEKNDRLGTIPIFP